VKIILILLIFLTVPQDFSAEELINLNVQQAEGLALDDNYNIQSFLYLVDKGYYDQLVAVGAWLPQVHGNAFLQRQPIQDPFTLKFPYHTFTSSTLNFFQNVFNSDAYFDVKAANLNFKLTIANLLQATTDVLFAVRNGYFKIIALQLNVEVQLENVKLLQELVDREVARFNAGTGTPYLVNQSEASLENAKTLLYQAEREVKVAIYDFLSQLGLPPQTRLTLEEKDINWEAIPFIRKLMENWEQKSRKTTFWDGLIDRWSKMAYIYNPEVEIRRIDYKLDMVNLQKQVGKYTPKVNLFANYFNIGGKNVFPPKSYWNMGVNIDWDIFDGFARENRVKSAGKLVKSGTSDFYEAVLIAEMTIADRLAELKAAIQSYRSSKRAVEVAEEAVKIALLQKEVGEITFLDYLQSVQDLLVARQNFIRAKFDQVSAYFGLLRVAGADILNLKQGLCHTNGFAYFGDYEVFFETNR